MPDLMSIGFQGLKKIGLHFFLMQQVFQIQDGRRHGKLAKFIGFDPTSNPPIQIFEEYLQSVILGNQ